MAAEALRRGDPGRLSGPVTRRVPVAGSADARERPSDDGRVVVDVAA